MTYGQYHLKRYFMTDSKIKIVAIITARGGSKGLPRKNVLPLNGKPLIVHTIHSALKSNIFNKVIVTTDDDEIKEVSLSSNAEVINRPKEFATDTASSLDVLEHALTVLQENEFSHFMLLQPTSPLRNSTHIQEAMAKYTQENAKSLVSVTETEHTPYKLLVEGDDEIIPLFSNEYLTMPRQKLPITYRINGAIYISEISSFLQTKDLFQKPLTIYLMDQQNSIDIDTKMDLDRCENIIKKRLKL